MTVFTGGLGADSFYGTTGADTLSGLGGADSLNGNLGANQVNGGDGDDLITSTGGADTIDGGTGFDTWAGALGSSTANLTFAYDGSTGVGSLTGGTILSSIEIASLTTGTGNDVITIKHPGYALGQTFRGGTGSDTFAISDTGSPIASVAQIQSNGAGGFTGKFENVQFYDFESIDITLTDGTGSVYVNGAALAAGIKLTLDGGGGLDVLNIDFSAISSVNIDFSAPAISSNINNFSAKNFEQVILLLGTGNNNVIGTGAADIFYGETGNDTIDGGGDSDQISGGDGLNLLKGGSGDDIFHSTGMDTVDGGVGNDTWYGDYGAFKIPLAFSYDGASRVGFLPGGGTLAGVEVMNFTGGAGDDSVTLSNFSPQVASSFVGGAGHDTFAATFSGFSPIIIDTDLAGGLGGLVNGKISFRGFEVANIVLGQTGQGATVYTSALMTANKLTIDGGAKNYNDISIHFNTSDSINFDVSNNTSITNVPGLATLNFRSYILDLTASGSSHVIGGSGGDSITGGLGDDTLEGGGGNDTLLGGAGHNLLIGGGGDDSLASGDATSTFNGGAGIDTVDFSARSAAVHIDLGAPPGPGGDTLINVEQIIGSSWNDTVTGDAAANTLMGGAGDDVLDGAGSVDTASYASATSAVVVSLTLQGVAQNTQGAGSDTLKGFENLIGSAFSDRLTGDGFANVIVGGGGNDTIDAGGGNDTISSVWSPISVLGGAGDDWFSGGGADTFDGGAGNDTVDYSAAGVGQWVDLRINAGSGGDTLINVEGVIGGAGDDTLTGSDGADTLDGGWAGDDILDGAGGIDTVSFASNTSGVTVSLALQGVAQDTHGPHYDVLKGFENLTGSAFNDQLNGDANANVINGGLGDDTIDGGLGNDTLDGGGGVDMLTYYRASGGVTVDLTLTTAQNTGAAGVDTLHGFRDLHGSLYDDVLRAGAGVHNVASYAGADLFYIDNGAAGSYDGGAGIDTLSFAKATSAVKASLATTAVQATGIGSMSFANFEAVVGSAYADSLTGSGLANTLTGGGGADTLVGGAGGDVFRYLLASDSTIAASDLINDFQHGIDKISLTAVRTGAADKYLISTVGNNTQLDVDLHGDGSIDMRILLVGKSVLTSADLLW